MRETIFIEELEEKDLEIKILKDEIGDHLQEMSKVTLLKGEIARLSVKLRFLESTIERLNADNAEFETIIQDTVQSNVTAGKERAVLQAKCDTLVREHAELSSTCSASRKQLEHVSILITGLVGVFSPKSGRKTSFPQKDDTGTDFEASFTKVKENILGVQASLSDAQKVRG